MLGRGVQGITSGMSLHMFDHVILAYEPFGTDLAHERFLSRVQAHVPPQIGLVIELFRTQRTLVRLVAGMLLLVLAEQFGVLEPFAAHVTLERLVALVERVVVLRQVADAVERLVALLTLERAQSVVGRALLANTVAVSSRCRRRRCRRRRCCCCRRRFHSLLLHVDSFHCHCRSASQAYEFREAQEKILQA